jgi:putative membrane protein
MSREARGPGERWSFRPPFSVRCLARETDMGAGRQWFLLLWSGVWRLAPWLVGVAVYCAAVAFIVQLFSYHPLLWETEGALLNSLVLGLLLAFRNRTAYDRWWEGRRLWGQLINETRNLAWKLKGYLPPAVMARSGVPAALAGFADALKGHLRDDVRLQDVPGFEKAPETPPHVPLYLAGLILTRLAAWKQEGLIDGDVARILDGNANALLDVCGACERIHYTENAPLYRALLRVGIALNILVAPWYTLAEGGYWGIPILLLVSFFLLGIEQIDTAIEEPFGTAPGDLDLDGYCRTIRRSVTSILNDDGSQVSDAAL